jgi:hypothetical protein
VILHFPEFDADPQSADADGTNGRRSSKQFLQYHARLFLFCRTQQNYQKYVRISRKLSNICLFSQETEGRRTQLLYSFRYTAISFNFVFQASFCVALSGLDLTPTFQAVLKSITEKLENLSKKHVFQSQNLRT